MDGGLDRGNWGHHLPGWVACMNIERQREYREYVCSNRDKEEQEVREKMGRRVIVAGRIERVKRRIESS